jgi:putative oxidoreductase
MEDTGKLVLRLALGLLILLHGIAKIKGGIVGISGMVTGIGLPAWAAYGVYVGEVLAPIMVIVGFYSRVGAFIIFINMTFAVALSHRADLFMLNAKSGGYALELQAMFMFVALALTFMIPGRYALTKRY